MVQRSFSVSEPGCEGVNSLTEIKGDSFRVQKSFAEEGSEDENLETMECATGEKNVVNICCWQQQWRRTF